MNEENENNRQPSEAESVIDFHDCLVVNNVNHVLNELPTLKAPEFVRIILETEMLKIKGAMSFFSQAKRSRFGASANDSEGMMRKNHLCQLTVEMAGRQAFVAEALVKALFVMDANDKDHEFMIALVLLVESIQNIMGNVTRLADIVTRVCGDDIFQSKGNPL